MKFLWIATLAVVMAAVVLWVLVSNSFEPPKPLNLKDLPEETSHVLLGHGGIMTYVEYGPADGLPVIFLHSALQTGRLLGYVSQEIEDLGLRVIAPDRQGWGYSDPSAATVKGLRHAAAELLGFMDEVGLGKVGILADGYGAPYAAAMVHEAPERFSTVVLVNPMAPYKEAGVADALPESLGNTLKMASNYPFTSYLVTMLSRRMLDGSSKAYVRGQSMGPTFDVQVNNTEFLDLLSQDVALSISRTWHGYAQDLNLISGAWDFNLGDIVHPRVFVFGGNFYPNSPLHALRKYTRGIRGSHFEMLEGGQWTLVVHFREIASPFRNEGETPEATPDDDHSQPAEKDGRPAKNEL